MRGHAEKEEGGVASSMGTTVPTKAQIMTTMIEEQHCAGKVAIGKSPNASLLGMHTS